MSPTTPGPRADAAVDGPAGALTVIVTDQHVRRMRDVFEAGLAESVPVAVEVRYLESASMGSSDPSLAQRSADELGAADVLVGPRFDASMAQVMPRLRLIQVVGAGLDGVDLDAVPTDVAVANTFHHEAAMAEYALWAGIDLRRGLTAGDRLLRQGIWRSPAVDTSMGAPRGLAGARVGLLGFGHVGERTWEAFRHFGAVGAAVTGRGGVDARAHGLEWAGGGEDTLRLFEWAEIVIVSVPLAESTRGLVGARELAALGPDGVLVNVARGPVVDEQALDEALAAKAIGGAAIDVWYTYPGPGEGLPESPKQPSSLPITSRDNTLVSAHISGVAEGTFVGRVQDVIDNIAALAAGRPLLNRVR